MMQKENSVGSVTFVGTLIADTADIIKLPGRPKSKNGLDDGLSKVIRPDSWQIRVDTVRESFTV